MEAALHPQAFGQVLTRIWQLMRLHLRLFLAIGAPPAGVVIVAYAVVTGMVFACVEYAHPPIGALGWAVIAAGLLAGLACIAGWMFTFALYEPAASYTALQLDAGRAVTFREAYAVGWSKLGRYFWLLLLRQIIISGPMILPALIFGLAELAIVVHDGQVPNAMAGVAIFLAALLYLAAMAWAVLAAIRLVLAQPASLAENLTAWEAIRRSNRLSQGGRLRIFLVALVLYALSYAVMLACELVFGLLFGSGAVPVLLFHLGPAWWITGIILLGICFVCVLLIVMMGVSSSYSVAFAILYREQVRMESLAAAPGTTG